MGTIFHEKFPNYWSGFKNFPTFIFKPQQIVKIWFLWQNQKKKKKKGSFFFGKIPKCGYLFWDKLPLNMGIGPELLVAHP